MDPEEAAKDQAAKDQAAKEQAAKDRAAKVKAALRQYALVVIGVLLLAGVGAYTLRSLNKAYDVTCPNIATADDPKAATAHDSKSAKTDVLQTQFPEGEELFLNGAFCLGLTSVYDPTDPANVRADADKNAAEAAVKDAKTALDIASKPPQATLTDEVAKKKAGDDLKAKQSDYDKAVAKRAETVKDRPAKQMVLFMDDQKTETTFYVEDQPGLQWKRIEIALGADATSEVGKTWRKIIRGGTKGGKKAVVVGVGEASDNLPRKRFKTDKTVSLVVFLPFATFLGGIGLLLLFWGALLSASETGMLRDRAPSAGDLKPPYSLARVQMAWWLAIVVSSFIFLLLVTGQYSNVVTPTSLGLLGISITTGLAAINVPASTPPAGQPNPPPAPPSQSNGFVKDITANANGPALQRLQMVIWTVILGLIFAWSVTWEYTFPAFDTTILLLSGLVGGSYLGFKFGEPPK